MSRMIVLAFLGSVISFAAPGCGPRTPAMTQEEVKQSEGAHAEYMKKEAAKNKVPPGRAHKGG